MLCSVDRPSVHVENRISVSIQWRYTEITEASSEDHAFSYTRVPKSRPGLVRPFLLGKRADLTLKAAYEPL